MYLEPGVTLRWNFRFGGQLSCVVPVRVVAHGSDGLWLWLAAGSPLWDAQLPGSRHLRDLDPAERPPGGYPLAEGVWHQSSALIFQPDGAGHAVWWLFAPGAGFGGWYVNLEHRVREGEDIHVNDLELDLTVEPDRSWQWKDEESFAAKTGHPAYWTAEQAAAARAEGRRVAALAEAGAFPFDGTWCDYRPPADWGLPALPPPPPGASLPAPAAPPPASPSSSPAPPSGPLSAAPSHENGLARPSGHGMLPSC